MFDYKSHDAVEQEKMVKWLRDNKVLEQSLKGHLHHPQYVKKVEELVQVFAIRQVCILFCFLSCLLTHFYSNQRKLSVEDVEAIWNSQVGQHDSVVR